MLQLLLGLVLFFGMHSMSIVALPLRNKLAAKSDIGWKLVYSLISLLGIVLMVRGYADLKLAATILYTSPIGLHYVAVILLLPTFVLSSAPYFPGRISRVVKHPQLLVVQVWALAHLLVNGALADVLLFGSFLVWAVLDRSSMSKRTSRPVPAVPQSSVNDIILIVAGLALYALFVFWLHEMLFGVRPF